MKKPFLLNASSETCDCVFSFAPQGFRNNTRLFRTKSCEECLSYLSKLFVIKNVCKTHQFYSKLRPYKVVCETLDNGTVSFSYRYPRELRILLST